MCCNGRIRKLQQKRWRPNGQSLKGSERGRGLGERAASLLLPVPSYHLGGAGEALLAPTMGSWVRALPLKGLVAEGPDGLSQNLIQGSHQPFREVGCSIWKGAQTAPEAGSQQQLSVCMRVGFLVTRVSPAGCPAKTAEPIDMSSGRGTHSHVDSRNTYGCHLANTIERSVLIGVWLVAAQTPLFSKL